MGYGKVLLMLHGYLSSKESFIKQINFFSRFMRVVAVDMTGFGKGQTMEYPFSLDDYADEICALLDAIGEEKVDVIAHSFGARVVTRLLGKDKRIDKIVFTGAAGLKPRRRLKYFLKKASFFVLKKFVSRDKLKFLYSEDYRNLSPVMKKSFQKIIVDHLDEEYAKIQNKTLLVFGKNDRQTPPYMAKRMKKLIKDSRLYFLANAGHFCFIKQADKFNTLVFNFLTENGK
ncbi:MAG: alpha/beta hydrolase [Clostridia bacterium]|nr:alpha/beta hydrolase [Clostridia bacterium]